MVLRQLVDSIQTLFLSFQIYTKYIQYIIIFYYYIRYNKYIL